MSLAEVKDLHEKSSPHDVMALGKLVKFVIEPCTCGIRAKFVIEKKKIETYPEDLQAFLPPQVADQIVQYIISEWHWHPKFWQRPFGMKFWLRRWIKQTKGHIQEAQKQSDAIDQLRYEINTEKL